MHTSPSCSAQPKSTQEDNEDPFMHADAATHNIVKHIFPRRQHNSWFYVHSATLLGGQTRVKPQCCASQNQFLAGCCQPPSPDLYDCLLPLTLLQCAHTSVPTTLQGTLSQYHTTSAIITTCYYVLQNSTG
jgi:hypothetical protein